MHNTWKQPLQRLRQITREHLEQGQAWAVDRMYADTYLGNHIPWLKRIKESFRRLREQGMAVTYVDVCGRAFWPTTLVQHNLNFSLQRVHEHQYWEGEKYEGDIFNTRDFNAFMRGLAMVERPALITLVPVSGLRFYDQCGRTDEEIERLTRYLFVKRLEALLRILRPGGFMYITPCFAPDDTLAHPVMEDILRRHNCTYENTEGRLLGNAPPCLISKAETTDTPRD